MKRLTLLLILLIPIFTFSQIINIPDDFPTIQEGINAAINGDTVLVDIGTYFESINFEGKAITVASNFIINGDTSFISKTIIDATFITNPDSSYAIYFISKEDSTSTIIGFTLKYNAWIPITSGEVKGGPFLVKDALPKMEHNTILGEIIANQNINKPKTYITWINLIDPPMIIKGSLQEVNFSSLVVIPVSSGKQGFSSEQKSIKIEANQLDIVRLRRKGRIGRGIAIGAVSGFALGGIIGLLAGDDPPCPESSFANFWFPCTSYSAGDKALMAGIPLTLVGAGLGAIIGSIKIKIPINGDMDAYSKNKKRLKRYAVKNK